MGLADEAALNDLDLSIFDLEKQNNFSLVFFCTNHCMYRCKIKYYLNIKPGLFKLLPAFQGTVVR